MTDIGSARPTPQDGTVAPPTRHEPPPRRSRHSAPATRHEVPQTRHDPRLTRHEAPVTRHEAVPAPRPGGPQAPLTRHESGGPPAGPGVTRHQETRPAGPVAPTIPPRLQEQLVDVVPWKRSGQSELLRAVDRASGEQVFVKVYFEHIAPDTSLLDLLGRADRAQVVPVIEHGEFTDPIYGGTRCWEMQPYLPGGTLSELIARTPPEARAGLAREVLEELTAALHYCHDDLDHAHRDLKPDNVLVAGHRPLDLVLADFGSSRSSSVSRQFSAVAMTELYAAPEALNGHLGKPQDWWALGMVLLETLLGRHPYAGLDSMSVRDRLTSYDVDVSAVADNDWRLLLEGLLTRSREYRWGAGEIERWCRGERPDVHRVAERGYPPIDVDGHPVETPRHLAAFFLADPERAQDWLLREHTRLADWLADDVGDTGWSVRPLRRPIGDPADARRLMASFVAHVVPDQRPRFRGHATDVTGLRLLASNAESASNADDRETLTEVVSRRLLGVFARHRCTVLHEEGCGDDGCRLLGRLATDPNVPLIRSNAYEMLASWARRQGVPGRLGAISGVSRDEVSDRAEALALGYLLDADRIVPAIAEVRSAGADRPGWWTDLRDAALGRREPNDGLVALALAVATKDDSDSEQAAQDRDAAERAAEADRAERERRDRERAAAVAAATAARRATLRRIGPRLTRWGTPGLLGTLFLGLLEVLRLLDPAAGGDLYRAALSDPTSIYRQFFVWWYSEANRWLYDAPLVEFTAPLTKRAEPWAQHLVLLLGVAAGVALYLRTRVRRSSSVALTAGFAAVAVCAAALSYLLLPETLGVVAGFGMGTVGILGALVMLGLGFWIMVAGS